jgi:hypothetical protein
MVSSDDAGLMRVPDDQLDYDEELFYTYHGLPFTGIGYERAPRGGLSEISYQGGAQDGPSRDWYPNGRIKSEAIYRKNVLHGYSREFNESGALTEEREYEFGILKSSTEFDELGNVVRRFVLAEADPQFALLKKLRMHAADDDG